MRCKDICFSSKNNFLCTFAYLVQSKTQGMIDDSSLVKRVAVLITCFNRKEKTIRCLESIYSQKLPEFVKFELFIVDDGSTDGTAQAIQAKFPEVNMLAGDGNLFWAGGMRFAWNTALATKKYDFFWLVNDDTSFYPETFSHLLEADRYAITNYGVSGIYSGSTRDPKSGVRTYGGEKLRNRDDYATIPLHPNGQYQSCEFTNANILLIPASVVDAVGIFSDVYVHSIADFDYSMRVMEAGLPVLILPEFAGFCENDHNDQHQGGLRNIRKRLRNLFGPKGYSYKEFLYFVKTHFPKRYANTVITLWLRTLFPSLWSSYKNRK